MSAILLRPIFSRFTPTTQAASMLACKAGHKTLLKLATEYITCKKISDQFNFGQKMRSKIKPSEMFKHSRNI